MQTSYFARLNSKNFKGRVINGVSIARSARYWSGRTYPPLFPTWDMINLTDPIEYEEMYRKQVLDKLDAYEVFNDLGGDAVLLCHESFAKCETGETFCHRHMVAKWLEEQLWLEHDIDITINELKDVKEEMKQQLKIKM